MVTLTIDGLGEFSAPTQAEASRLAAKARRDVAKKQRRRLKLEAQARLRACEQGYRIHEWLAEVAAGARPSLPRAVRLVPPGASRSVRYDVDQIVTYRHEYGEAQFDHLGYRVKRVLENAAGWPMAVVLTDGSQTSIVAVGGADDVMACVSLTISVDTLRAALHPKHHHPA